MSESSIQIDRYHIKRELGRGAMGVVYEAFDILLERLVAIKTINLDHEGAARLVECLKREAKSIARLEHPNIVTLYDACEVGQIYYLVLQFIEGKTLSEIMSKGRGFQVAEAVRIVLQLLAALGYAHSRGVVHRDVKPSNIMLRADGSVKLMDFGVARPVGTGLTSSGLIMGTPGYMSPEQAVGSPVDGRSDIFSVGCALYELLTGRKPFDAPEPSAMVYRAIHERPAPIADTFDPMLSPILAKALAKDPRDRFQSCAEFTDDLRRCLPDYAEQHASGSGYRSARFAISASLPFILAPMIWSIAIHEPGAGRAGALGLVQTRLTAAASTKLAAPIPMSDMAVPRVLRRPIGPRKASGRDPKQFNSLIVSGDEAFQQGRYNDALARYSDACRLQPGRPLVAEKLKLVMTVLGRAEEEFGAGHFPGKNALDCGN